MSPQSVRPHVSLSSAPAAPLVAGLAHVAIIMDGNRRWAKQRHLPVLLGHQQGVQALKQTVTHAIARRIQVLTVYAFSTENWQRPADEVSGLMDVLAQAMVNELDVLSRQGVRVVFLGNVEAFSPKLKNLMASLVGQTTNNKELTLQVALNYGGRAQLVSAVNAALQAQSAPGPIGEADIVAQLEPFPPPDLLIRTGGEQRLSNFLLWQLAYSELYFTETLWPDFGSEALDAALDDFTQRQRRFGK